MINRFDEIIDKMIKLEKEKEALLKKLADLEVTSGVPYLRFASLSKWDHYEEVHHVLQKWRKGLKYVPSDVPDSELGVLVFDFNVIGGMDVIRDLVRLINHGALACSMKELARILVKRTNLGMSEEGVYSQLKRYKKIYK